MDGLEERVAKIEGVLGQIDKRLKSMDARLNHLSDKMEERFNYLGEKIDSNFKSTVKIMLGILIPMWVTIIGTVVGFFVVVLSK